ncbi:beta strand repeat-containing protein [Sphingobium sp. SCG-1]|uniref:beta strand repeat-containing protein n=1 Tax=Sphingobium sp. SCG-1 TaxID=2072936 RepID=UPI0016715C19|nr:calcium-binding protein [Sphingobium sp. SCG-1]
MPNVTFLTTGNDTVLPLDGDQVVAATSATLTAMTMTYDGTTTRYFGDQLDGGAGYDVLSLTGSGNFNLSTLLQFTGFEEVRLTNATSSAASLTLRDGVDITVTLSDGTAPSTGSYPSTGGISVALGTGRVTLQGGNESDTISASAAGKLRAGSIIDGGVGYDTLNLSYDYSQSNGSSQIDPATGNIIYVPPVYRDTVYDLTSISLSHMEALNLSGNSGGGYGNTSTVAKVDTAALAGITQIYAFGGAKLVTASASLDLSGKSISGALVESSNTTGTTFTVNSASTALQVQGGTGQDSIVVSGLTLTSAQRDQIFTGSVERITDASGTYTKAAVPAGTTVLTTGNDTVLPLGGDQVVAATSATLTAMTMTYDGTTTRYFGDQLDGGAGYDVLSLTGSGNFNLSTLLQFTGFEEVRLTNATSSAASLTLRDGVDITVTLSDGTAPSTGSYPSTGGISVALGTGRVTLQGGNESDTISASAAGKLRAGSIIDGGVGYDTLNLSYDYSQSNGSSQIDPATGNIIYVPPVYRDTVYDLTSISLSHMEALNLSGNSGGGYGNTSTVAKVDTAALAGITQIYAFGGAKLVTASASLDLSGKSISGALVESSNTTGTTFTVNSASTALQVQGGTGQDSIVVSGLTLTSAQRDQIFTGSVERITDASGTYTKAAAPVEGTSGNDILDGGPGADRLTGLGGDDTYLVDNFGDIVIEAANNGTDLVRTSLTSYTLGANVENLIYTGTGAFIGTGNELANTITGSSGADTLDGKGGVDTLRGGAGNDNYTVDNAGDVVSEETTPGSKQDAGGIDLVSSSVSYTLGAFVENLTLTGSSAIRGTGNELANSLTGNAGANSISGLAGNDVLLGHGGNDTLNGGIGADRLEGGSGDDIYFVDNVGDVVVEVTETGADATGTDLVNSSVSFTLKAFLENLTLTGSDAINGTGNGLANKIMGNAAPNTLYGLAGDDTLEGGAGADMLAGGDGLDFAFYGAATQSVKVDMLTPSLNTGDALGDIFQSIEGLSGSAYNDWLAGDHASNTLSGGAGEDYLIGRGGNDLIIGGAGKDTLNGGWGNDTFQFGVGGGRDVIEDFGVTGGQKDYISLDAGLGVSSFAEVMAHAKQVANNTLITFDTGDSILLYNTQMTKLVADDFLL